jgi:glycosyltransferase involved in cell wall biosynthesis
VNQNEVTGLVVPPRDPAGLVDAIARLLQHPELQERFGAAGRRRYLQEFTADRMVEGVMRVYAAALTKSG